MATPIPTKTYVLDGMILDACSCNSPCPCWVGDAPDGGQCNAFLAYHIERGQIRDLDVAGLSVVEVTQVSGKMLEGHWRQVLILDAQASPEQQRALVDAFSGQLGGPLADLAGLIDERLAIYVAPIDYQVRNGQGSLRVGEVIYAEIEHYTDAAGRPTRMMDSHLPTIPDSFTYVAKAPVHRVNLPDQGMTWEFSGRNALQGEFHFETA
jgi:hypothetical protein